MKTVRTSVLEIGYLEFGPADGRVVILLHGWPSDVHDYDGVAPPLADAGFRVLVPWLRGFGPTRFLDPALPRSGQQAALGADVRDFMDALSIRSAILVGYDWGGRAACVVAALWPQRVSALIAITGYAIQDIRHFVPSAPPEQEYGIGTSGISIPNGDVPGSRPIEQSWHVCFGGYGRRTGYSVTRSLRRPQAVSTIRTSST